MKNAQGSDSNGRKRMRDSRLAGVTKVNGDLMASDQVLTELFYPVTWNSEVAFRTTNLAERYHFAQGAVVGMLYVDTPDLASNFGMPIGSRILDIEGPLGDTVTVSYEDVVLVES